MWLCFDSRLRYLIWSKCRFSVGLVEPGIGDAEVCNVLLVALGGTCLLASVVGVVGELIDEERVVLNGWLKLVWIHSLRLL